MEQRLERNIIQIHNQKTRSDRQTSSLNRYFVSMDAKVRSIAQHLVCIEQNILIVLSYLTSWSRYIYSDSHSRDFGRPFAATANMKNSLCFGNDTDAESD